VMDDVEAAVASVEFPLEHHAEIRGAASEAGATPSQALPIALAAALAIFLLLQAAFTSWRLAILAFATLPVALAGGIVAALVAGETFGLGAIAGSLAVVGIATRSVVLVVRHYQHLERDGAESFGDELVLRGTRERLLPTVVTALGTIIALAPILVMGDVAGLEIVRPMAIVMIGGVITSALLVLFVLPALYRMHGFVAQRDTVADELIVVLPEAAIEVEPVSGS
jgi:Cu/Ag efflux pump CusA